MLAVHEGYCSAQDLMELDDLQLMTIAHWPNAINAIREGRTTLEALRGLSMEELQHGTGVLINHKIKREKA